MLGVNAIIRPKVFISYTHEDEAHKNWVRVLAERLVTDGVDVILDQWDLRGGMDITKWIEDGIGSSERVLVVLTPEYRKRANKRKGGVGWESIIITGELFAKENTIKFVGLLKKGSWKTAVPSFLQTRLHYDFLNDISFNEQYQLLLDDVRGRQKYIKPKMVSHHFL